MQFLTENNANRKSFFPVRGKLLRLPIYFPSISSVKTGLSPFEYFNILQGLGQPNFLVSAFDIDKSFQRDDFISKLQSNIKNDGSIILMDSGNYESWWMRDRSWTRDSFNDILKCNISDLSFCYDNQTPPANIKENVENVSMSMKASQSISKTSSIIPIVHCNKERLVDTILELYNFANFEMIAIPERILGEGILERIKTVTRLRKELNKLEDYKYIHLLGTGNPYSLLLFSFAGADSFDGLEWCQTVVDPRTAVLYHFQQRELIIDSCNFCKSDLDYTLSTLGHNINFYNNWMKSIQNSIESQKEIDLLKKWFDSNFVFSLSKIWS